MIKKESHVPEDSSRSEIVTAINSLEPYESIVIHPVGEHTRQQVYTAASRARKAIRTKLTAVGLRVWLKDQPPKKVVEQMAEVPMSKEEKLANLRAMMSGEIDATPREVAQAISETVAPETDEREIIDIDIA